MMEMKSTVGTTATAICFSLPRLCSLPLTIFNIVATLSLFLPHHHVIAQSSQPSSPRTDPIEVEALNSIFSKWNISSNMSELPWNYTGNGDPCTGNAIFISDNIKDNYDLLNPSIFCDCSSNNGSTCHIVRLTATGLDITGTIPDELKTFSKLNNLQIAKNYLTGPLPAFIGNFSEMLYLSIGLNSLSGPIPKELGNLKKLRSLGIGSRNNFSGPLPPELGNLTSLEQMYVDSNGLSGPIPETLVNLQKLKILWASDNNFGGKVPEFIGNITTLRSLRLQGNSFIGPIPSSFNNLVQMQDLRLGDISNVSSSLMFIRNMTSLNTLVLRDCMISDAFPSNIGQYKKLKYLDMSFNNIGGQLPTSLFNLEKLKNLYLGNNSISGSLPDQKIASLSNIDLSYNDLSGAFPQWVRDHDKNLQLNLVANNFDIDSSNRLSWGLGCLQRDVPCGRGSPNYYSFAINCGSNDSLTYDGADYERDNMDLSSASYHVTNSQRWAVSNVGTFMDSENPRYVLDNLSNIQNTTNVKIFQSARLSPSSLRYYGLRLENGNYTVRLLFAELAFLDYFTWYSFGKRIFNIYVQGNLVEQDFDIRKEAGRRSFRAIERNYTALVTKNFMEIHFFWAGKGTCCIPTHGSYGPLISAISITPNFKPSVTNEPPNFGSTNRKNRNKAIIAGIVVGIFALFLIVLGIFIWRRKKNKYLSLDDEELVGLAIVPHSYSYTELKNATKGFSSNNKLGEGGFGAVFKGKLDDGKIVALKQMSIASLHRKRQFVTEVATISTVKHRNLVRLHGCCYEGNERILVYEHLENGSLDRALFGKSGLHLDWTTRFNICLGTARGLAYLHEESNTRIIHRDIKAGNILLDANLSPKISDFGLAKLYDDRKTHISTRVAGTVGYLAPEYVMRGRLTEKADIFAFGIVALEIISGRPSTCACLEEEKFYLLEQAWRLHEEDRDMELIDPTLSSYKEEEVRKVMGVALLCTQVKPLLRPSMSRVVAMLVGDVELGEIPSKQAYMSDWYFHELEKMRPTIPTSVTYGGGILSATDIAEEGGR